MGIITKTVKVKLASKNIEHYKSKGYEIPIRPLKGQANKCRKKRDWGYDLGKELDVKVEDLPTGSNVLIDVVCDCCGKSSNMRYIDYNKQVNDDDEFICFNCRKNPIEAGSRNTPAYRQAMKIVMERDRYTCQCCGKPATDVHHLNSFNWFIEGREDPDNCLALCYKCHTSFHSTCGYGDNTKEQYYKWTDANAEKMKTMKPVYRDLNRPIYCFNDGKIYINKAELKHAYPNVKLPYGRELCSRDKHCSCKLTCIWYDEYITMTEEERDFYCKNKYRDRMSQRFVCLDTGEIFESGLAAAKKYHTTSSTITQSLDRESYAGRDEDGNPMHWMRYEEYLDASPEYIQQRLSYLPSHFRPVVLLNTGEKFNKFTDASRATGIHQEVISKFARGLSNNGGTLANGEPAVWSLA